MSKNVLKIVFGFSIFIWFLSGNCQTAPETKLNFVLILADDLGYSDVGYMNQKPELHTPNIDNLAKNGMVFTNAYASCPVCSPTRASLLTGKYPATLNLTCHIPGAGMEDYLKRLNKGKKLKEAFFINYLPLEEITIAEVLKEKGYTTGFIGKWHLAGDGSIHTPNGIVNANFHPEKQGFDINVGGCAYGQPKSYFSPYKNGTLPDGTDGEYLTDRLGNEAVKFIEENKDHPFFLDLSTYTVHTPLSAPSDITEKYKGNKYFAMIEKLDQTVGKVIDQLKKLNLIENTVIIFYSDNGGVWGNPPLRDNKGSLYEGGIRVPLIISCPSIIAAAKICDVPVTSVDFFPTILELINISPSNYSQLEGMSLAPLLHGNFNFPERAIYWHFPHHRDNELSMAAAIREGDWKCVKEFESGKIYLFNLKEDQVEERNLSSEYRGRTKYLLEKLKKWQLRVGAKMPQVNESYEIIIPKE